MENLKIGERIKKIRTDRGITKYNFAKSIGISDSSLANYENEFRVPSADIIYKICDVYGVSADYLIRGIEDINKNTSELLGLSDTTIERFKKFNPNNIPKDDCIENKRFIPTIEILTNNKEGKYLLSSIYDYLCFNKDKSEHEYIDSEKNENFILKIPSDNLKTVLINNIISCLDSLKSNINTDCLNDKALNTLGIVVHLFEINKS